MHFTLSQQYLLGTHFCPACLTLNRNPVQKLLFDIKFLILKATVSGMTLSIKIIASGMKTAESGRRKLKKD